MESIEKKIPNPVVNIDNSMLLERESAILENAETLFNIEQEEFLLKKRLIDDYLEEQRKNRPLFYHGRLGIGIFAIGYCCVLIAILIIIVCRFILGNGIDAVHWHVPLAMITGAYLSIFAVLTALIKAVWGHKTLNKTEEPIPLPSSDLSKTMTEILKLQSKS